MPDRLHELHRGLIADGAVRSLFVVLSPISLAFKSGIVQRQEPVLVDAFGPHLAVERFHESNIGRFAGPGEVQHYGLAPRPEIEIPGDEFRSVVDANRLRHTVECRHFVQCVDDIGAAITLANIDRRRQTREGIDDRQDADLRTIEEVV